jgi:formamidopyrimidine-DNA glycosylase
VPELPDVVVYLEALERRVLGEPLARVRLASPFLLRSVAPPLREAEGRRVVGLRRLGKRLVIGLDGGLFLVLHLMIAGRLRWRPRGTAVPRKNGLAAFDFPAGTLLLTEAGSKKRASLHLVAGEAALAAHDPGGLEVLDADLAAFAATLGRENHTLKRALTDPHLLAGIGNAYSDEILHRARLSPFKQTSQLSGEEMARLFRAARETLGDWLERTRREVGEGFPEKVTAFREGMAVHGRFRQPCPVCGSPVQRLVYAGNEANYCPTCQTGGRLLADRALSRLLKADWPRTLEELEARMAGGGGKGAGHRPAGAAHELRGRPGPRSPAAEPPSPEGGRAPGFPSRRLS